MNLRLELPSSWDQLPIDPPVVSEKESRQSAAQLLADFPGIGSDPLLRDIAYSPSTGRIETFLDDQPSGVYYFKGDNKGDNNYEVHIRPDGLAMSGSRNLLYKVHDIIAI